MKKGILISILLLMGSIAVASNATVATSSYASALGLYDFAAPAALNVADVTGQTLGAIVFETSSGTFQGYTGGSTWIPLSVPGGNPVSSSDSGYKIETASLSAICGAGTCSLDPNNTTSGIASITWDTSAGNYRVNFNTSPAPFTQVPNCVFSSITSSGSPSFPGSSGLGNTPSTSMYPVTFYKTVNTTQNIDAQFSVICMGH